MAAKTIEERVRLGNLEGKICPICKEYKLRNLFEISNYNLDKMKTYCQVCRVEYDRIKRIERKSINPSKYKILNKNNKLMNNYGITIEDYEDMLKSQGYKCKICNKSHSVENRSNLYVDHCHTTNKVRGLICNQCNKGLGDFKDNIEFLESAIRYLKEYL